MNENPRTYIIEDDPLRAHCLDVRIHEAFNSRSISVHSNHRPLHSGAGTSGFSPSMAQQLCNALRAVLSGQFDRAVTDTLLRLEQEDEARRSARITEPPLPSLSPELDQL